MINIQRYHEAPECLIQKRNYRCSEVVNLLEEEFYGKCYLCETDRFSVNVEHFIPHKNSPELKFNWNNLFYACDHCNNLKGDMHILDCTNLQHDVENRLAYHTAYFPWHEVIIETTAYPEEEEDEDEEEAPEPLEEAQSVNNDIGEKNATDNLTKQAQEQENIGELTSNTVKLLNRIYNGSTSIKTKGAAKLKQYLIEEMIRFQDLLLQYEKNKFNKHASEKTEAAIAAELDKASKLTAFKRQIIKDIPALREKFEQYFN